MKVFQSIAIALMLSVMFVSPLYADSLDTSSTGTLTSMLDDVEGWDALTRTEQLQMLLEVEQKATAKIQASTARLTAKLEPGDIGEWVDIGERIGKMLGGAAREVGVAVNDFVDTPVGKMTMVLIVWNYMGSMIVHVFGGLLVMVLGLSIILYMYKRSTQDVVHYDSEKTDIFGRARLSRIVRRQHDEEPGYLVACAVVMIASIVVTFTF